MTAHSASPGRVFIANVGANASHRFAGPVFEDGTFEFLPIPETPNIRPPEATLYRDLRSWYDPNVELLRYIPERLWDVACHNDPEFHTFTYGDNCDRNARAAGLKSLRPGDFLFFLVRLQRWNAGGPTADFGFYFVGYLEIDTADWALRSVNELPRGRHYSLFRNNAHVIRGQSGHGLWDGFWVFRGSRNSKRFRHAVPVTRDLCERVFRTADGRDWQWERGRSDLQVIGSYTRACRCVLNTDDPGNAGWSLVLWDWVRTHGG